MWVAVTGWDRVQADLIPKLLVFSDSGLLSESDAWGQVRMESRKHMV